MQCSFCTTEAIYELEQIAIDDHTVVKPDRKTVPRACMSHKGSITDKQIADNILRRMNLPLDTRTDVYWKML